MPRYWRESELKRLWYQYDRLIKVRDKRPNDKDVRKKLSAILSLMRKMNA